MGYKTGADDGSSADPVAHGIVKEFWLENGLHRWRILYDDFHVEDFDKDEMMEFGLDRKSGSVATFPHTELPATASTDQINSNPWVTVKAKRNFKKAPPADRRALLQEIVKSQQPAACLCGCSSAAIITLPNVSLFPTNLSVSYACVYLAYSIIVLNIMIIYTNNFVKHLLRD
jgi:hypothetical protein